MKKRKTDAGEGKGALELVEEAVQLLRRAPIPVHLFYYIGSVPFVLALLYFWSDMSRGAFAYDRIVGSSLELAFLFLWMKSWQAAGLAILRAHVSASPPPHWTPGRIWRLVVTQAALQPTALFVRPIALLITIPYPQVRAYYENAMILGDGSEGVGAVSRKAWRQAMLWKKQSIFVLLWLLLFGVMVSTNLAIIMEFLPETLRMFTGVESRFSQIDTTDWMLNTTFMAVVAAFAYLCVNPVTKATYVLRCFYGESLHTGEDLMLGMRRAIRAAAVAAAALLLAFAPAAHGADSNAPAPAPASGPAPAGRVKPGDLDNTISRVLKRDIYSWRLPRQQPGKSSNPFAQFLDDTVQKIRDGYHSFQRWLDSLHRARRDYDDMSHAKRDESVGGGFAGFLNFALWAICGIVVLLLVWLLWQNRSAL
ncbi:MAG TPA: hypothetical protein VG733_10845, partial [Chthoniobacteraceae bacterium]|nr:hypothetical protein [Chthoniobacteraceae bacterium]